MKLLGVRSAKSIWLFPTYFLNPNGIYTRPIIEAMKTRYNFQKTPLDKPIQDTSTNFKYEDGMFKGRNGTISITSMTIHEDGIVIEAKSSTEDGDAFLEDALVWCSQEFGLATYSELPITKIYASELNVSFKQTPAIFNPKFLPLLEKVTTAINDVNKGNSEFLGFQLSTDFARSEKPAQFKFEREINVPFKDNRFYSFSQTTTESHIKLLKEIEKLST